MICKNMCLAAVTSDSQNLGIYLNVDCQKSALNLGMTVPVALPKNILQWTFNYQFQFTLPDNATELTPYYYARSLSHLNKRSLSGGSNMAERSRDVLAAPEEDHGVDEGDFEGSKDIAHRGAVYRSLEAALDSPDYGSSSVKLLDEDYLLAQDAGKSYWTSCQQKFPECPPGQGLLDLISLIEQ
uniref:Uncharacterized protein n=1 Tax=Timema poppense TaxID=170557 RepID=A0A7R9DMD3_TIMPO|nr:unnamed protein product [Timema poppensis]